MASADVINQIRCSICMEIYEDPVTLMCGHNFCRNCITQAWDHQEHLMEYKCPECQHIYRRRPELKRNQALHNIAEGLCPLDPDPEESGIFCTYCDFPVPAAKCCLQCETSICTKHLRSHDRSVEHTLLPPTTDLGKRKCLMHKKILEYYCMKDFAYICASCRLDGEHKGHPVKTLEEVSKQKKMRLRNDIKRLTLEREKTDKRVQRLQEHKRNVQRKAAGVTERVTALFRDFRRQLQEQEKRLLSDISRWEEQISLLISGMVQQLEEKKEQLSRKMSHVQDLCSVADPLTILQDPDRRNVCDSDWGGDDNTKILDEGDLDDGQVSDTLYNLFYMIKKMQVWIKSPILLDEKTAGRNVHISGDKKTASYSEDDLHRPATPERFQNNHVLSFRSISSGQLSWEVDTSNSNNWRVGICYSSMGRETYIGKNNISWCLLRYKASYQCRHGDNCFPLLYEPSIHKFRICVDYNAGQLSFYELCDPIRHLYTFSTTFTEPLHAAVAIWHGSVTITN